MRVRGVQGVLGRGVEDMGERVVVVMKGVVVVDQDQGEITLQNQAIVGEAYNAQDPLEANQDQVGGNQYPVGEGQDPVEEGQDPVGEGQDPAGEGQDPAGQGQDPVGEDLDPLEAVTVDQMFREVVEDQMVGEEDLPDHQEEDLVEEGKSLVLFLSCQS